MWKWPFRRRREEDLDEEIRAHLAMGRSGGGCGISARLKRFGRMFVMPCG
jgi:hypothetical protein